MGWLVGGGRRERRVVMWFGEEKDRDQAGAVGLYMYSVLE